MTRACPSCRLRFSRASAAPLPACPFCGAPLDDLPASAVLGFRLMATDGLPEDDDLDAVAVALALQVPRPEERRYD